MNIFKNLHHPHAAMTLLRISLAVLMLLHGWAKVIHGVGGIEGMLTQMGLPAFFAYGVFVGEVVAPLLLLLGLYVVPAAWVIAINMLVAIGLAHAGQIFELGKSGGWAIELQAFFLINAIVVALGYSRKK